MIQSPIQMKKLLKNNQHDQATAKIPPAVLIQSSSRESKTKPDFHHRSQALKQIIHQLRKSRYIQHAQIWK
jgi:hypothetical protein